MKKRLFFKNAAILSATSLFLKTVGIFFRVWLSGKLGAEGMGLYQLIFSLYVLGSTLATSGLSTAVTRLVADALALGDGAPPQPLAKPLLSIAVPITAGRYLSTALRTAENLLVPTALSAYSANKTAGLAQFGTLKGMAMPLLFFPASFLAAFSTLLIPEMSEALSLCQPLRVKRTAARTVHVTLTASILFGGVFFACAYPLGRLLYHTDEVGFLLRVLAPLVPVMYLESTVDGILKGLNQQTHSLLYSVADSALRIGCILVLVPRTGMGGFLFVMLLSNFFTCSLNVRRLCAVSGARILWGRSVLFPALCAGCGVVASTLVCGRFLPPNDLWQTVISGCITTVITVVGFFCTGVLTREECHLT